MVNLVWPVRLMGPLIGLLMLFAGCAPKPLVRPPVIPPPPSAPVSPQGIWQANGRSGPMKMLLKPDGGVVFQGGLDYFNPGRWEWNPMRKQLTISLPRAGDEKLQIFQLYVGDGVKYFDRAGKAVVYHFDDDTTHLNVAGWEFSRNFAPQTQPVTPEPRLR